MKNFYWFKQISNNVKSERRLSLGEYKRAVSWSKYLVSSGGEIKGEGEEWSADMSQLLIGNKFASGRHSRIYRGIYKQRDVAIKIISQPEEDENLANFLEKQFISEVALLFHLRHPNIITANQFPRMQDHRYPPPVRLRLVISSTDAGQAIPRSDHSLRR
ncbi:Serine/threonine-protein kinase HT1 [Gossypium arboreum]|uniref:Serine/threonine-protein kinase HT1 n=1 Tax=Gossypium arboreum TaxID=29729 RepID=A0A0B0NBR5_GOSAR|nr:Serine/threonine-protein kinase HT1 [Gossypium arboreum]